MKKKDRESIYLKYNKRCTYCGKYLDTIKDMQVDHIIPKCHIYNYRKVNCAENLTPSCKRCNHYKRSLDLGGFRRLMLTLHERIEKQYINRVAMDYGIITKSGLSFQI
jgi:5-methylcytosine-specific restriction endonuclease McrA